jgi:methyl-accepting chemotaxis protein
MERGRITMPPAQRKIYIIKRAFQLRYIFIVLMFIFLTAVMSSIVTYLAIFPYLSEKLANVYPQGRLVVLLRNANAKAMLSTFFVFPVAVWFSVILSHRIAGPWYRLEMSLQDLARGDLSCDISLRKNDELQSLAILLNKVIQNLREVANENIGYAEEIGQAVSCIDQELNREPVDAMKLRLVIGKAQNAVKGLNESLKRHKLK